jgi:precorrin-2/cobalt-factor-2 C20-methyltransferase
MVKGKIYGVALGPGDPDLLTLKALKCLQKADRIYYPGSISPKGVKSSHSLKIMSPHGLDTDKMQGIFIKMSMDRNQTEELYSQVFQDILEDYRKGLKVVIVSEGDIAFYSTFAYLLERIYRNELDFEMIAGIPAFILAGSVHRFPLALQSDKVAVLAQLNSLEELEKRLKDFETVVIMKLSTVKGEICQFIRENKLGFFYGERLGTDQQYTTTSVEELENRRIPYFSLMIFNKYIHLN